MSKKVEPHHRFIINNRIAQARKVDPRDIVAGVENVACYWESFPASYSPDQVAAATRLILSTYGTQEYSDALVSVAIMADIHFPAMDRVK